MSEKRHVWEKLKITEIAVVDELASTAELVMGKSKGIPIAVIRGFDFIRSENALINGLIREREKISLDNISVFIHKIAPLVVS